MPVWRAVVTKRQVPGCEFGRLAILGEDAAAFQLHDQRVAGRRLAGIGDRHAVDRAAAAGDPCETQCADFPAVHVGIETRKVGGNQLSAVKQHAAVRTPADDACAAWLGSETIDGFHVESPSVLPISYRMSAARCQGAPHSELKGYRSRAQACRR